MSVGYVSYAAPLATTPATLGVTSQPVTTTTGTTTAGNAAVNTGYDATPVATTSGTTGGGASQNLTALANQLAPTAGAGQQSVNAAANIATQQLQAASTSTAATGGSISDALKSGVSKIVAFAQDGMARIQQSIQADMAANNGEVPAAKMQLYTMQMSTYELLNQMAAKIQEKEERSIQVWLR